jgi:DNA-binding response OmpR family regulator
MARVVIVEPDRAVETLLVALVSASGDEPHVYRCAADLDEADVILLEPEHTAGLEAVRRALTTRRVPVVCVSIAPKDSRSSAIDAAYVAKPFRPSCLRDAVAAALHRAA